METILRKQGRPDRQTQIQTLFSSINVNDAEKVSAYLDKSKVPPKELQAARLGPLAHFAIRVKAHDALRAILNHPRAMVYRKIRDFQERTPLEYALDCQDLAAVKIILLESPRTYPQGEWENYLVRTLTGSAIFSAEVFVVIKKSFFPRTPLLDLVVRIQNPVLKAKVLLFNKKLASLKKLDFDPRRHYDGRSTRRTTQ